MSDMSMMIESSGGAMAPKPFGMDPNMHPNVDTARSDMQPQAMMQPPPIDPFF